MPMPLSDAEVQVQEACAEVCSAGVSAVCSAVCAAGR